MPEEIAQLPNLKGYGNLYSLHQAMLRDDSGELKALVRQFVKEANVGARHELTEKILLTWTKQNNVQPDSRGYQNDARHLGVLEAFWGTSTEMRNPFRRLCLTVKRDL